MTLWIEILQFDNTNRIVYNTYGVNIQKFTLDLNTSNLRRLL